MSDPYLTALNQWLASTPSPLAHTDDQLAAELKALGDKWHEFRDGLDEDGGMAGSPGEWMIERMSELETEQKRRAKR